MHHNHRFFILAASLMLIPSFIGCHDDRDNAQIINKEPECSFTEKKCNGNATQVCSSGKLVENPCPDNTLCTDGTCLPQNTSPCDNFMIPDCSNNQRVYCENQTLKYETCPTGINVWNASVIFRNVMENL